MYLKGLFGVTISLTIFVLQSVRTDANEHIPGRYLMVSKMKNEKMNQIFKEMEFKDEERNMMRHWHHVHVEAKKIDSDKYEFGLIIGKDPYLIRTYENGKEIDDIMPDGRKFKSVVTFANNVVIRKDTHPNFVLTMIGEFSEDGVDSQYAVEKAGNTTKASQAFEREPKDHEDAARKHKKHQDNGHGKIKKGGINPVSDSGSNSEETTTKKSTKSKFTTTPPTLPTTPSTSAPDWKKYQNKSSDPDGPQLSLVIPLP